jgi:uncharacterized protein (TIGR02001 family)
LGNWNSNISWISDAGVAKTAPIEMDFYGGYKGEVTKGLGYDVGGLYYYYPTTGLTGVNPNTFELYGALSYGPATLKYSQSTTNLFGYADSKNSYYVDFSVNQDLGAYGLTANAHVGYQKIKSNTDYNYTDWKLGLTKDFGNGLSGSLAYIGTNAKDAFYKTPAFDNKNGGKGTAVISLTKTF